MKQGLNIFLLALLVFLGAMLGGYLAQSTRPAYAQGAAQPVVYESLSTRALYLVDDAGKSVGTLRVGATGAPNLILLGKGQSAAMVSPTSMGLMDAAGVIRILSTTAGQPQVLIKDGQGNIVSTLK
jgi:hypothetical protein